MPALFASLSARIALVFVLALAVISVAILSQYWGGLMPCALCLKQRVAFFWPCRFWLWPIFMRRERLWPCAGC